MQSALDRRQQILDKLMLRRQDTVINLASEFGVNERTIRRDICILSHDYPICSIPGKGGGVRLPDGYYATTARQGLTEEQFVFLQRLADSLSPKDKETMREILLMLRSA